jgi:hypothetical protein
MQFPLMIWFIVLILPFVSLITSTSTLEAYLYENGTCTDEELKEMPKQTVNTNGTVDDFLESLPSDNMILTESFC